MYLQNIKGDNLVQMTENEGKFVLQSTGQIHNNCPRISDSPNYVAFGKVP